MDLYGILLGSQASGIFHRQHTDWGIDGMEEWDDNGIFFMGYSWDNHGFVGKTKPQTTQNWEV